MDRLGLTPFEDDTREALRKNPVFARAFFRDVSELPVPLQLSIMRRVMGVSQYEIAVKLRVQQPHVARLERAGHDPRLSSIMAQAQAIGCRVALVPGDGFSATASMVRDKPLPKRSSKRGRRARRGQMATWVRTPR